MENDNLTPEMKENDMPTPEVESNTTELTGAAETTEAPVTREDAPDITETTEELTAAPVGESLTVIPDAPAKKKTGLIVGGIVAVLAVCVVAAVAIIGQPPERVVNKALETYLADSQKLSEQMKTELPALAKQTELAESPSITNTEIKLNSIEIPQMPPMIGTLLSGTTISGTTKADPANSTYDNSYSLTMFGQKLGTVNLFNSPTIISAGMPEYFANTYYLDVDKLVENGWDSYLFSQLAPTKKEDMEMFANAYKGYIQSLGAMNTEELEGMVKRFNEICAEKLTGLQYATVKADGKKLYTVTIPAESVNATVAAFIEYVYLESPVSSQIEIMMPPDLKAEWESSIRKISAEIATVMPTAPTVVTLDIKGKTILGMDILCEGPNAEGAPVSFSMSVDNSDATAGKYIIKLSADEGEDRVGMNMTIDSFYAGKVMDAKVDMDLVTGDSDVSVLNMSFDYKLDGNLETDNVGFNMTYSIASPIDGIEITLAVDSIGDYYLKDESIVFAMDDIEYNIITQGPTLAGNEPISINMNLSVNTSISALTEQLTQPEGVDILTLNETDLYAIIEEADAIGQKVSSLLLGQYMM